MKTLEALFFFDEETDEMVGWIPQPFMNDAGEKSYSENIQMDIEKEESEEVEPTIQPEEPVANAESDAKAGTEENAEADTEVILEENNPEETPAETEMQTDEETQGTKAIKSTESINVDADKGQSQEEKAGDSNTYILTMTVDEEYLNAAERQYPITIDPSHTWKGNSKLTDAYVISGSKYKNTNFYSSGTVVMPAGKGSYGTYRTYMKIADLEKTVKDKSIASATLTVYGAGQSSSANSQKIAVKRVTSSWKPSTLKWTNKPSNASATISSVTAGKTSNKKYTYNVQSFVQGIANGNANYGIVFMNINSSPKYMSFRGSRYSKSSYRPKLVVTYYNKPVAPSEVAFDSNVSTTGEDISFSYSGISSDGLKEVSYQLQSLENGEWTNYSSVESAGSLGAASVDIPGTIPDGRYRVAVWATNVVDVEGPKGYSDQLLVDTIMPQADDIVLKSGDTVIGEKEWTEENDPLICIDGITDNNNLSEANIKYSFYEVGHEAEATFKECQFNSFTETSPHNAIIRLNEEEKALPSGKYVIKVKVTDEAGNSVTKAAYFLKDNEDPKGRIKVLNKNTNQEEEQVKGIVSVCAELDGTGSNLEKTKIELLRISDKGETVVDDNLCGWITKDKTFDFDTKRFDNGEYKFRVALKDEIGRSAVVEKSVFIANPLDAPTVKVNYIEDGRANAMISFGANASKIEKVEYKIGDGEWTTAENYIEGIKLRANEGGEYEVLVRGIDKAGVYTKTAKAVYICDITPPEAEIISVDRGIVRGIATDRNLKYWNISVKQANIKEDYVYTGLSGKENVEGTLGILDYNRLRLEKGVEYELKLTATDQAGNKRETEYIFQRGKNDAEAKRLSADYRIKRPSYCSDYSVSTFTIPSETKEIDLIKDQKGVLPDDVSWYIDNKKAGEGRPGQIDFNTFLDNEKHGMIATSKSDDGYAYSSNIIQNGQVITAGQNKNGKIEIETEDKFVSFRLRAGEDGFLTVRTEDGSEASVETGETTYIADITEGEAVYANKLIIESEDDTIPLEWVEIQIDTLEEETIDVSELANFIPDKLSVKERLNGRVYLYWENKAEENDEISYNVYRSEQKEFEPSEETLAASGIKAGYFSEINVGSNEYYYAVTAVRNKEEEPPEESLMSKTVKGVSPDYDETMKRLGDADYWKYTDFSTPNGQGKIEESQGNFTYTQEDMNFEGVNLETGFSRTYNSRSSEKGAFGRGWTHSFDLQLLSVCQEEEDNFSNLVFRDGTGTIYRFIEGENGKYVSSQGEYITLTKEEISEEKTIKNEKITVDSSYTLHTSDNIDYRFNSGGQLVYITEPNGSFMVFEYQPDIGFLSKVTNDKGISVTFEYTTENPEEDMVLVDRAVMPDGSERIYSYDSEGEDIFVLKAVTEKAANGNEIVYRYDYTGKERPLLKEIKDAEGNKYSIAYDDQERVERTAFPNGEGYLIEYNGDVGSNTSTKVSTFIEDGLFSDGTIVSETESRFEANTGYCTSFTDALGKIVDFEYTNAICTKTSYDIKAYGLDESGNRVSTGVVTKTVNTDLGSKLEEKKTVYEDGSYEKSDYDDAENELESRNTLYDADGNVLEDNKYEYDENGNEKYDYDAVEDRTTVYTYDAQGSIVSEKVYEGEGTGGTLISESHTNISYGDGAARTEVDTEIEDGITTTYTTKYDEFGRMTEESEVVAGKVETSKTITYDGFGRIAKETVKEDDVTAVTSNTYDKNGLLTETREASTKDNQTDTITTSYTYDSVGRQTKVTVNDNGEITSTSTSYGYTDITVFDIDKGSKTYSNVSVVKSADQDGYVQGETYTTASGLVVREKEEGVYIDNVYDDYGTAIGACVLGDSTEYTNGQVTLNITDEEGRITHTITNPEKTDAGYKAGEKSIVNAVEYDAAGRVSVGTDGNGGETEYSYDDEGDLASVTLPGKQTTRYESKEIKSGSAYLTVVKTTDANGNISEQATDESGNTRYVKDFDGEGEATIQTKYEYNASGQCVKETEAKGNFKTYSYDEKTGYVSEEAYYDADENCKTKCTYTYDLNGNVTRSKEVSVNEDEETHKKSCFMTYDKQGRLTSESTVVSDTEPTEQEIDKNKISYQYDINGNVTEVEYAFRTSGISGLKYSYDKERRIKKITTKDNLLGETLREYEYDRYGRLVEVKDSYDFSGLGENITRKYTYDAANRLTSIANLDSKSGKVIEAFLYTYDKNGNIVKEESATALTGTEGLAETIREYTYDANSRLTKTTITEGGQSVDVSGEEEEEETIAQVHEYEYDAVGNRTKAIIDGDTTTYTFNGLNQLVSENTVNDGETTTHKVYTYDSNGNQTGITDSVTGDIVSMSYNEIDMMDQYEKTENGEVCLTQKNTYDASGQRIKKQERWTEITPALEGEPAETETVEETTNYSYQGGSLLATTDEAGAQKSFNLLTPGGNIISTARTVDGEESWYLYNKDDQGSTTSIIGENGNAAAVYDYDEYGNVETISGEDFDNEICYTGQIYDKNTGLHYYNARFYDSETGIFTSQDTYRGENSNPLTLNLYAYCAGNPVNNIDPTGHSWFSRKWKSVKKTVSKVRKKAKTYYKAAKKAVVKRVKPAIKKVKKVYRSVKKAAKKASKWVGKKYKKAKKAVKKAWNATKKMAKKAGSKVKGIAKAVYAKSDMMLKASKGGKYVTKLLGHGSVATSYKDTATEAYNDINSGKTMSETVSNAFVNAMFATASIGIGLAVSAALISNPVGWMAVAAVGVATITSFGFDAITSYKVGKGNKSLKRRTYEFMTR